MSVDWPRWANEITRLYVTEDKSAEETIQILRDHHNVKITIRQFKSKYSGLKNLRANEWRAVKRVVQKRKADGIDSAVFLNNRQLDPNRLVREMRRYCGTRSRDSTENEASIDLGIDTVGKHRVEIRSSIPQRITGCQIECPSPTSIVAGNVIISAEDSTNQYITESTGWMSSFELEDVDLSTPKLGTVETSFYAGPLNEFQHMINDTETQQGTPRLPQEKEFTPFAAHQYQSTWQNPRRTTSINASAFNMSSACLSPRIGDTLWSSNLSLPTFFLLPDVYKVVNNLDISSSFTRDNMNSVNFSYTAIGVNVDG